jgi:hypothetical protein
MPIKFYKTNGIPKKTFPNSEEIHFTDDGYVYVADNEGEQQLMYRGAINSIEYNGGKGLTYQNLAGDKGIITFNFYSTEEADATFISQAEPTIGGYDIYHAGNLPEGLLSESEIRKLASIEWNADVNQNAFQGVNVGNTTVSAVNTVDTLKLIAGENITLTADKANRSIEISSPVAKEYNSLALLDPSGKPWYLKVNIDGELYVDKEE